MKIVLKKLLLIMSVGLAMNSFAMEQTASPKIFPVYGK